MTDSNRVRMTTVKESALGTTPASPRMRTVRFTGESLAYAPSFVTSDEIRSDRMNADPIKVNESNSGPVNGELSFPPDRSPLSTWLESLLFSAWQNTPSFDNDGTADSVITDAGTTTDTYAVASGGSAVKAGHMVRATGFGNAANNQIFRVASSTVTTIVGSGLGLVAETAPAASARLKVVGFAGVSGDITSLADGLGSTALDFTALGLNVGQWVKIGGAADASTFAYLVAAGAPSRRHSFARVTAIAAHKLTLDNLPAWWATDAGTGKTIQVFFGDTLKNGVTMSSHSIERGFMAQASPSYIVQRGMVAGQGQFVFSTEDKATWQITFTGLSGAEGATSLSNTPDAASANRVMAAAVDVGRIAENGVCFGSPNWMQRFTLTINNNPRVKNALTCGDAVGPVDIGSGEFGVTFDAPTYFGSDALLAKLFAGTPTNLNARIAKDNQALIFAVPRATFTGGAPSVGGKNQDVILPLTGSASIDALTNAHLILDRFEYYA